MESAHKRMGDKITTKNTCKCGYTNIKTIDLGATQKEKGSTKEEKKQFRINQDRFCISQKEGQKYVEFQRRLERISEMMKKDVDEKKEKRKIKTFTVFQIEEMLRKELNKKKYVQITFSPPEMGKDVIIEFTVQESSARIEYDSKKQLKKVIIEILKGTNWCLMSEGVSYRL